MHRNIARIYRYRGLVGFSCNQSRNTCCLLGNNSISSRLICAFCIENDAPIRTSAIPSPTPGVYFDGRQDIQRRAEVQNIVSPTIPTYAAAYAADLNPAVVWTWISRGLFQPDGEASRVGMKERVHSPVDVLRLAIVAKIARYGFTIRESFEIVRDHVDRLYGGVVGVAAPGGPVQVDIPLAVLVAEL